MWLDAPEEGHTWTYAEILDSAEGVGGRNFLAAGHREGG